MMSLLRFLPLLAATAFAGFGAAVAAVPALLLDGATAGSAVIAVGERGVILRSADSGRTWEPVASPADATLTGLAFAADGRHGWAVGHDALILATTDGGLTWNRQWQGPDLEASFLDVCALDAHHVIAVGAYGLFAETQDGGRTWATRKVLADDMHLNRLSRGPAGTLYLAGEHGTLLRSRDAGATWTPIDAPYDGSFYGILPLGGRALLAHGLRGRVYRSDDDGDHWTSVPLDQPALLATALRTGTGAVILAGQSRAFFVSRDAGRHFAPWATGFTAAVAELVSAPDGTVIALGEAGATRLEAARSFSGPAAAVAPPRPD